jgi:hypothetical protein
VNPALTRGSKKAFRDLLQVVAAGGATALVTMVTGHLHPEIAVLVAFAFKLFVTFAQNTLETSGAIPTILPTAGLVTTTTGGIVGKTVGTVDTVTAEGGQVVGDVLDKAGNAVGAVAGAVGGLIGGGGGL